VVRGQSALARRSSASGEGREQQGHHGEVEESEGELGHGKAAVVEGFDLG
jgi:hypothetical protein